MKKNLLSRFFTFTCALSLIASSVMAESTETKSNEVAPDEEVAIITTVFGDMVVAFWPDVAPNTVENFKKLARDEFYDGTAFHRVIPNFMIQGGCPNTKEGASGTPGTGGPGHNVKAEFNDRPHVRGVLSMARSQHPDSAGSQFFVVHGDAGFLDNQYTAFGKLISGEEVLDKLATAETRPDGRENSTPRERLGVKTVRVVKYSEVKADSEKDKD